MTKKFWLMGTLKYRLWVGMIVSIRQRGDVEPILIDPVEGNLQHALKKVLQADDLLLTQGAGNVGAISVELASNHLYLK
jgi:UDP-N-acetylmuramate--alanine ligase